MEHRQQLQLLFEVDDVSQFATQGLGPMPVVSSDQLNTPSLLKPIQAFSWFMAHGGGFGSQ
tara:strand:- start:1117 stop:1299 length:183 start_codon:yes stop_codon:yes gene_type:complete